MRNVDSRAGTCRTIAVAHVHRLDVRRDQQAASRVDVERPRVEAARIDALQQLRLAARWVDRERREAVLPASEHLPAVEIDGVIAAVDAVDDVAARVHVNGAAELPRPHVGRLLEQIPCVHRPGSERIPAAPEKGELVLPLERDVDPGA